MRRIGVVITIAALGLISSAWAQPLSLAQAWQAARAHDPTYQAAVADREAAQSERAMGRAALLPQISGTVGRTRTKGHLESPNAQGDRVRQDLNYTAKTNQVVLEQMVFDWDAISGYRQGHAKADQALAAFDTHTNENSERLVNRYFQVLLAHQQQHIAQTNLDATEQHVRIAQRYFDQGEGTVTAIYEAQARYDMAQAQVLLAQDALTLARYELQEMVGSYPQQVYGLQEHLDLQGVQPDYLQGWLDLAMQRNAQIRLAAEDLRVNALEIQRAFSGHLPSVYLTASLGRNTSESLSTRNQKASTRAVGAQVNVPIFSGGRTWAQTQQAGFNRDSSQYDLEAMREEIAVEVTRQYQGVVSGIKHIQALEKAVSSNEAAVESAQRGYMGGTSSIRDILDAQERLYNAELDLTKARLDFVLARLMLAALADGLDGALIEQTTHAYFSAQPIDLPTLP